MIKFSKIVFIVIFIIIVLMLSMFWFRENNLFVFNRVKVINNNLLSDEEIIELADLKFSQEIFDVDTDAIKKRLITHPLIKNVSISRQLPSAIKIKVEEQDLIATVPGSKLHVLNSEGNIVETDRMNALYDLPIITGIAFKLDSLSNTLMYKMTMILKAVRLSNFRLYQDISEIHYDKRYGIILYLRKKAVPIIFGFNEYSRKIIYLSTIYDYLQKKNELSIVKTIDVRFKDQVVVSSGN